MYCLMSLNGMTMYIQYSYQYSIDITTGGTPIDLYGTFTSFAMSTYIFQDKMAPPESVTRDNANPKADKRYRRGCSYCTYSQSTI